MDMDLGRFSIVFNEVFKVFSSDSKKIADDVVDVKNISCSVKRRFRRLSLWRLFQKFVDFHFLRIGWVEFVGRKADLRGR